MMRKKKVGIELQHNAFGLGQVRCRKTTDYGDALLIQFADKVRIVLVASGGWVNPADAEAAFKAAREEPKLKERVKPIRVRPTDETVEVGEQE